MIGDILNPNGQGPAPPTASRSVVDPSAAGPAPPSPDFSVNGGTSAGVGTVDRFTGIPGQARLGTGCPPVMTDAQVQMAVGFAIQGLKSAWESMGLPTTWWGVCLYIRK